MRNKFLVPALSAAFLGLCMGCGTTPPIAQTFNGSCASLPDPADPIHEGFETGYGVLIYGLGRLDTIDCANGTADVDLFDGKSVPGNIGVRITGDGHLTTLNVSSTAKGSTAQSGKIIVYINSVPSVLTCTLGTLMNCGDKEDAPAVRNGDFIAATVQLVPGDEVTGLQVVITKE